VFIDNNLLTNTTFVALKGKYTNTNTNTSIGAGKLLLWRRSKVSIFSIALLEFDVKVHCS